MRIDRKRKKQAGDISKRTLNIKFEQYWSVCPVATLGDGQKIKNNFFLVSEIFPGIADSVILLRFECTTNPQNFMKIIGAIFGKMRIVNFFPMWTTLNFEGSSKTKKWGKDISKGTLHIECERDWLVGLDAALGDELKIKNYFSSFRDFSGESR